jgi:tetratricopeptide (TPR) repeat protein
LSAGRKWIFRLLALTLMPLLLLGGLEIVLRLAHYGYPTGMFQTRLVGGKPVVVENDKFSWRFFPRAMARHPLPLSFSPQKPEGVYRIFVFGESAAMGDPEPSFGFSRILEALLRERFPQARFEVINLGITAINSHVILPIARDCARQPGDLWVIYMGHNEVPGPFGPGTIFGGGTSRLSLIRATLALKSTRIGQLLDDIRRRLGHAGDADKSWRGLEMFLDHQFAKDDPQLHPMYANFRENLTDILRAARHAGVNVVLCTAACNLKDGAPFGSLHTPNLSQQQKQAWDQSYAAAEVASRAGDSRNALELFQAAAKLDSQFAALRFQLGQLLLAIGQQDQARTQFEAARDLDTLRFRTDSRLNEIVERTSQAWRDRGVSFCDTRQQLAKSMLGGIPGDESFFDHVHLTFAGNYSIARAIADQVVPKLPQAALAHDVGDWATAKRCAERLAFTDWNELQLYEIMRHRLFQAPFTNQLNHLARQRNYAEKIASLRSALQPDHLQASAQMCRDALALAPDDPNLHENFARILAVQGDNQAAIDQFKRVLEVWPQQASGYNNIGLLLQKMGRGDEAEPYFQQALRLRPTLAEAHNGLGLLQLSHGNLDGAIARYREALQCNPDLVEAQVNLGQALQRQDKLPEAEGVFRQALETHTNYAPLEFAFGELLFKEGKVFEAGPPLSAAARAQPEATLSRVRRRVEQQPSPIEYVKLANVQSTLNQPDAALQSLQTAVRLNTNFWQARYLLGVELATRGRVPEAQEQFLATIQLQPDFALAHLNLGVALARQMQLEPAAAQFRDVLRLDSTNQLARHYLERIDAMTTPMPRPEP